jgi:DNA repair protein RecN (Recombination protein N)
MRKFSGLRGKSFNNKYMLTQLIITDFAIISRLEIEFTKGLNILSGETGAGKSIIINAVNLILGARASNDLVRGGAKEARIEALFRQPENENLKKLLRDSDIPFDGELLIKRTISKQGRNKITVNNSITSLQTLSAIGMTIISISGQHEHQFLLKPDNHLLLLDDLGDLNSLRNELAGTFFRYEELKQRIKRLEAKLDRSREKQELSAFQAREIETSGLEEGEDNKLEEERKRLKHAEKIKETVTGSYYKIYERENSVISEISTCLKEISTVCGFDKRLSDLNSTLESLKAELEEVSFQLADLKDEINMDPDRLENIEDRLQTINSLKRKYGPTIQAILKFKNNLLEEVDNIGHQERELQALKVELKKSSEILVKKAIDLSEKRKKVAGIMNKSVESELGKLEMTGTRFNAAFNEDHIPDASDHDHLLKNIGSDGFDRVEFMIAPNVGEELKPLSKIASGGELSRIMLALKTILAKKTSVETIIFDEVDAGIGGATAEVVGEKINSLSEYHQILCITHLPQIACKGKSHFLVEKNVENGRTQTFIMKLTRDERVEEIARLMGGRTVTEQAIAHAKEMLGC